MIDDLAALVKAARRADVTIRLTDAYRSYAQQKDLWERYVDRVGAAEAALLVDRPGHSEHQLGTTLDIAKTRGAYAWLADRAWRFGFVISYPEGRRCRGLPHPPARARALRGPGAGGGHPLPPASSRASGCGPRSSRGPPSRCRSTPPSASAT